MEIKTLEWKDNKLILLDCRKLPEREEYFVCENYQDLAGAIKDLIIRGAPAIGVAAAYGVALAYKNGLDQGLVGEAALAYSRQAIDVLAQTRPTAVNLFWALNLMSGLLDGLGDLSEEEILQALIARAHKIYQEDIEINKSIGRLGSSLVSEGSRILTHCNAGALATAGYGTALGVVRASKHKNIHLYIDETRPLLQGSRLTAWEALREGIPASLITDSMAGYLMQLGQVDMVIFGADRIASNGDVANKIGSYSLAVLAHYHKIPLYVAAPKSTIDPGLESGDQIPIEEREAGELIFYKGVQTAPQGISVFNPAFDLTPHELISGIITEDGILTPPYRDSIRELFS